MRRAVAAAVVLGLVLGGCTSGGSTDRATGRATAHVTVFAAASLTEAFSAEGAAFERSRPKSTVEFSFAGSQALVAQIQQGAPADVVATADDATMRALVDRGLLAGPPQVFAANRLVVVVAKGNPKHITTLGDLARPDVDVVLAGPAVPAGRYAGQLLAAAGVMPRVRSEEQDVRGVVSKVRLGEADAGLAYVTDVEPARGAVEAVEVPEAAGALARYPLAVTQRRDQRTAATAFMRFVLSPAGQAVLQRYGFLPPPP